MGPNEIRSTRIATSSCGTSLKSSSTCHLNKSIGPDGQQHHKDGVERQDCAFERTKMALQDKILKIEAEGKLLIKPMK
eukprot:15139944-Ditylum_brightwellii.AAC.1